MGTLRGDDRRTLEEAAAWFTRLKGESVSEATIDDFMAWRRTPANDAAEAKGILLALGEEAGRKVPVSSTKALVGHTLGAAGAVEQCFCLLALERGFLPVQANLADPDPACPLRFVRDPRGAPRTALNNALGFGGANGALLSRRWEEGR